MNSSSPCLAGDLPTPDDGEPRPAETLTNNGGSLGEDNCEPSTSSNATGPDLSFRSSEALAKGISSMLGSLIRDFDYRAENTLKSQDQVVFAVDRLTGELDRLLEDAPLPFIMKHASKIVGVRKRVSSLNSLLKSIQRRIDNIDRMLSAGVSHEKVTLENARQSQH